MNNHRLKRLVQLSAIASDAIQLREREEESRIGNAMGGAGTGAAWGAGTGAVLGSTLSPVLLKKSVKDYAQARRGIGSLGGLYGPRGGTGRKAMAATLKIGRTIGAGGAKGRLLGAALGAAGYGATGAAIGGAYGLLRKPQEYGSRMQGLVALGAIADKALEIKFSGYEDEDESHLGRNALIAGGVGAGGLYGLGRSATKALPYGPLPKGEGRGVLATMGRGASRVGDAAAGVKNTFMKGYTRSMGQHAAAMAAAKEAGIPKEAPGAIRSFLKSVGRGVRGVARGLTGGKSKLVGLSSRHSALIQLSEKLDALTKSESGK